MSTLELTSKTVSNSLDSASINYLHACCHLGLKRARLPFVWHSDQKHEINIPVIFPL